MYGTPIVNGIQHFRKYSCLSRALFINSSGHARRMLCGLKVDHTIVLMHPESCLDMKTFTDLLVSVAQPCRMPRAEVLTCQCFAVRFMIGQVGLGYGSGGLGKVMTGNPLAAATSQKAVNMTDLIEVTVSAQADTHLDTQITKPEVAPGIRRTVALEIRHMKGSDRLAAISHLSESNRLLPPQHLRTMMQVKSIAASRPDKGNDMMNLGRHTAPA